MLRKTARNQMFKNTNGAFSAHYAAQGKQRLCTMIRLTAIFLALLTAAAQASGADGPAKQDTAAAQEAMFQVLSGLALTDRPSRSPDGSVTVPKSTQRLFTIATEAARMRQVGKSHEMMGVVIANSNASGQIQSFQAGRIEALPSGMPFVGMAVTKGQLIATLRPTLSRVDQNTLLGDAVGVAVQIRNLERQLAFYTDFPVIPFRERRLESVRVELEGARKRYELATSATKLPVSLIAPVDGVIGAVNITPGQIVDARETLVTIIDPKRLIVEASATDLSVASSIMSATARTVSGQAYKLNYIGSSPNSRGQFYSIYFEIEDSTGLSASTAVNVVVEGGQLSEGIVAPRQSAHRTSNGEWIVWQKMGAERFVSRQVSMKPLNGDEILISAGLSQGNVIVVSGANLLGNFR